MQFCVMWYDWIKVELMGMNVQMVALAYAVLVSVFYRLWIRFDLIA
jgi:hypothetical protein